MREGRETIFHPKEERPSTRAAMRWIITARAALGLSAALLLQCLPAASAVAVSSSMTTFGHSIKNGAFLPKGNEITTFEHTCTVAP